MAYCRKNHTVYLKVIKQRYLNNIVFFYTFFFFSTFSLVSLLVKKHFLYFLFKQTPVHKEICRPCWKYKRKSVTNEACITLVTIQ